MKKRYLRALVDKINIVLGDYQFLSFDNNHETYREILLSNNFFYIGIYYLKSGLIEFNSRYYTRDFYFRIIVDLCKKNEKILQQLCYQENIRNPAKRR
jgi:hypothetical protein